MSFRQWGGPVQMYTPIRVLILITQQLSCRPQTNWVIVCHIICDFFFFFVEHSDRDAGFPNEGCHTSQTLQSAKDLPRAGMSVGQVTSLSFRWVGQSCKRCFTVIWAVPNGHLSVSPMWNLVNMWCLILQWPVLKRTMITCSSLESR